MNNTFDINRFGRYAKAELHAESRRLLRGLAIFFGVAILMYTLFIYFVGNNGYNDPKEVFFLANSISLQIILIASIVYISASFSPFLKRGLATQNMMLPVSNAEKFTYRLAKAIAVPVVLILIFYTVSLCYSKIYDTDFSFLSSEIISKDNYYANLFTTMTAYIFTASIYFFGAIFWRKSNLIKTFGVMVGVGALLSVMIDSINKLTDIDLNDYKLDLGAGWIAVWLILSVGVIYLAWRRFKGLQILK